MKVAVSLGPAGAGLGRMGHMQMDFLQSRGLELKRSSSSNLLLGQSFAFINYSLTVSILVLKTIERPELYVFL